jgi:hypothetical protein
MSYSRKELASDLRGLAAWPVRSRADLDGWYAQAKVVTDKLMTGPRVLEGMSHFVWHYLVDADIRLKDPRYAEDQNARLAEVIAELEGEGG